MTAPSFDKKILKGRILVFDADDTLWENERNYNNAETGFSRLMAPLCRPEEAYNILMKVEGKNIPILGYGSKTLIIALVESAVIICRKYLKTDYVPDYYIDSCMDIGMEVVKAPMVLFKNVTKTLAELSKTNTLILATKGDIKDQTEKIRKSGLSKYFSYTEIMMEKDPEGYRKLLLDAGRSVGRTRTEREKGIAPEDMIMIGNSLKSDINPVLEIGGTGIYIPAEFTWEHEKAEEPKNTGFFKISEISDLVM
ncbi:MAG: HAD family hydrolase [Bacteroidales bacterium]|jgi:putative hydrolase of the HAD superfamily|nr:HAD family hydrolase [Bacteroidales bacterium]